MYNTILNSIAKKVRAGFGFENLTFTLPAWYEVTLGFYVEQKKQMFKFYILSYSGYTTSKGVTFEFQNFNKRPFYQMNDFPDFYFEDYVVPLTHEAYNDTLYAIFRNYSGIDVTISFKINVLVVQNDQVQLFEKMIDDFSIKGKSKEQVLSLYKKKI